ncbi:hypothetical protein CBR_g37878 [Chara braunii]|uniref:Uncharacterized protein n=1 Tax=Chara braunii TaxID=69332 RepID=A0A388LNX5_CHABU|nr:hypothetical protein CBR_g37878 [Chara braunii]|eukprot:GBG84004.1 hypothetical protein CBR_g37878 [Chara braunii]
MDGVGKPNQWPKFLRAAFFVENVTVKRTTKYARATLWYGRHATFPIESLMKTWRRQDLEVNLSFEELLDIRARQVGAAEERLREAADQVERSRMEDKMRWDQMARIRKEPLKVGDVVLLYDSSLEKQWSRKLDKRWLGPYRIVQCGEFAANQIEELDGAGWQDWVSGTRQKKFVTLLIWTRRAEKQVAKQIQERARDWEDCQAQLRRASGRPQHERHEPRVERRRRSKRPREPAQREVGLARERRGGPAQREDEPAGPALAEESFPACGLRAVEFRRITSEELRPPSPLPSTQELDIPRGTPFRSLATHLDVSQWEASRLGDGSVEPACYVPLEEPLDPEIETETRGREEPQDPEMAAERPDPVRPQVGEVITVGDNTPPCSPVPGPAQRSWPKGIPESGSEEIPESPPAATLMPEQEAEAEDQGVCEGAGMEAPPDLPSSTHVTRSPVIEEPVPAELPPVVPCASEGMRAEPMAPEGQGPRASSSQGVAVEVPRQAEPMEEAPLDAVEKESGAQESLMAMSTERRGSRLHELAAAMGIGTPQEEPQGLDAPEHAPRLGDLRAELGSWATGTDSGGPDSRRQQRRRS